MSLNNELSEFVSNGYEPTFIIRPDATITVSKLNSGKGNNQKKHLKNDFEAVLLNKKSDGYIMGYDAKRRLKNYVLSAAINGHLDGKNSMFATFTFTDSEKIKVYNPQKHDDLLTKLFVSFLNNLKVNYKLKEYVWVAERHLGKRTQSKQKGQKSKLGWLHFHSILVFDSFVDVQLINFLWLKKINSNDEIKCSFASENTFKSVIQDIKNVSFSDNNVVNMHFNNNISGRSGLSPINIDYLENAYLKNDMSLLSPILYKLNSLKGIKILSKFWFNPVDVEFLGYNKDNRNSKTKSLKKIAVYLTSYISKSNTDLNELGLPDKIYSRVWAASRLFTSQKHKVKIDKNLFNELIKKDLVNIIKREIEIPDKSTGEIVNVPIYTVVLGYKVYNNEMFLKLFENGDISYVNGSEFGGLLRGFLSPSSKNQEENLTTR